MRTSTALVAFVLAGLALAGCEYGEASQYGPGVTTGDPFEFESKPVGDASRTPYSPDGPGVAVEIPAGERPTEVARPVRASDVGTAAPNPEQ